VGIDVSCKASVVVVVALLPLFRMQTRSKQQQGNQLWDAATSGDLTRVVDILAHCKTAMKNWADPELLRTPLYRACGHNHPAVVRELLGHPDLEVSLTSSEGATPFNVACQQGHTEVVRLLLADPRVDINHSNEHTASPLFFTCQEDHDEVLKLLLADPSIEVNYVTKKGVTPLFIACEMGHVRVTKLLLRDRRVDINRQANDGMTAWMAAVFSGSLEIVKFMLAARSDLVLNSHFHGHRVIDMVDSVGQKEMLEVIRGCEADPQATRRRLRREFAFDSKIPF